MKWLVSILFIGTITTLSAKNLINPRKTLQAKRGKPVKQNLSNLLKELKKVKRYRAKPREKKQIRTSILNFTSYHVNTTDIVAIARNQPDHTDQLFALDLNVINEDLASGLFTDRFKRDLIRAQQTPAIVTSIVDRPKLELLGSALPKPTYFSEFPESSLVRLSPVQAVCRFSYTGVSCEHGEYSNYRISAGQRSMVERKRHRSRNKRKRKLGKRTEMFTQTRSSSQPLFDLPPSAFGTIDFNTLKKVMLEMHFVHPLHRMEYLNLNGNQLSGDIQSFKRLLCLMPELKELRLQSCGIMGTLPKDLLACNPNLELIDLSRNGLWCLENLFDGNMEFTGELDAEGRPLFPLTYFNLEHNPMQGTCEFPLRSRGQRYPLSRIWDYTSMRRAGRTTANEFPNVFTQCLAEEPNCANNSPILGSLF